MKEEDIKAIRNKLSQSPNRFKDAYIDGVLDFYNELMEIRKKLTQVNPVATS